MHLRASANRRWTGLSRVPDTLLYFAVLVLVALTVSRRRRIGRAALRWLTAGRHAGRLRAARAARRTTGTAAVMAALYGTAVAPEVTLPVLAVLASGGAGYGAYRARAWQQRRSHHRRWVRPAYMAAQAIAGWSDDEHPSKWLTVAPDRSLVTARLPLGWKGEASEQARLSQVLATRLGIESPVIRWQLAGAKPRLELTRSPPPPGRTVFTDALSVLGRAKPDELVWGRGKRGAWVTTSLSGDSPHVGLSMGSGAGKSVTARLLLAQMLHRGAIGLILDVKMISHAWAARLPNVHIARRPAEIHEALVWLGAEVDRRNEVALAGVDEDGNVNADVGPRIIVVAEELNATMAMLRSWWRETRSPSDPVRPPSITALDMASFTGRQVKCNIVYIGQRLSDKATGGGGDVRENIGVIAFGRWRASTWKMLAPDFTMPPKSLTPGRIHVVSDEVRECQAVLVSPEEAREYALSGTVSPLPAGMPGAPVQAGATSAAGLSEAGFPASDPCGATGIRAIATGPATGLVSLREAVEARLLGRMSLAAARTARARDTRFPAPSGRDGITDLYDLQALAEWASARNS